jgi:phage-related protein
MTTFTYVPDRGFSKQSTPRNLIMQFGDGYSHRVSDGINAMNTLWNLSFSSRSLADAAAIISFFESNAGVTAFQWTPPDEATQYNVVCTAWSQVYESVATRTISATFERIYQT